MRIIYLIIGFYHWPWLLLGCLPFVAHNAFSFIVYCLFLQKFQAL